MESHPTVPGFIQCVTKGYFKDMKWLENLYNTGTLCLFYFIPLCFIVVCYAMIIKNIDSSKTLSGSKLIGSNKSNTNSTSHSNIVKSKDHLHRHRIAVENSTANNTLASSIASSSLRGSIRTHQLNDLKSPSFATKSNQQQKMIKLADPVVPNSGSNVEENESRNQGLEDREEKENKLMEKGSGTISLSLSLPLLLFLLFLVFFLSLSFSMHFGFY